MKNILLSFFILFLISCQEDINDKKFRNSNYIFFESNGKSGEWRKIDHKYVTNYKNGDIIHYFFENGDKYGKKLILDGYSNREESFYNNDTLVETIIYRNDTIIKQIKKDGFVKQYYSNKGQLMAQGKIKNNIEEGLWLDYFEDGTIKSKNNYNKGLKNGKVFEYYEDGNIRTIGKYWQGKKIDTLTLYFNNGLINQQEIYIVDTIKNICIGTAKRFYENGNIEKLIPIINWKREGICEIYFQNGNLKYITEYRNDKINGIVKSYYENGILGASGNAKDSIKDGEFKYYDEKGNLIGTEYYKLGNLQAN